ncbi:MAG: hypothetical protein NXH87_00265 [Rhodobiaceae bacterium]|nr:hypothetical protein [Rhodobiaceae bacterium]
MRGAGRKIWLRNESAYPQEIVLSGPIQPQFGENHRQCGKPMRIMEKGNPLWKKVSAVIAVGRSIAYLRSQGGLSGSNGIGEALEAFASQKLQTVAVRKCDKQKKQEPGLKFIKQKRL